MWRAWLILTHWPNFVKSWNSSFQILSKMPPYFCEIEIHIKLWANNTIWMKLCSNDIWMHLLNCRKINAVQQCSCMFVLVCPLHGRKFCIILNKFSTYTHAFSINYIESSAHSWFIACTDAVWHGQEKLAVGTSAQLIDFVMMLLGLMMMVMHRW